MICILWIEHDKEEADVDSTFSPQNGCGSEQEAGRHQDKIRILVDLGFFNLCECL